MRAAAEMPLTRAETELTPDEDTALGAEAVRGIKASRERRYGLLRELGHVDSRFDDPLPEHELRRWEGATDA